MNTEHNAKNIRLTSSEISQLWSTYIANSMSKCVLSYFVKTAQDPDILSLVNYALQLSTNDLLTIKDIFNTVNFPVPKGFTESDVNINAKKLFSDNFMLYYLKYLVELGLINYGKTLTMCSRADVREFFTSCMQNTIKLSNKIDDILLNKGLYIRTPYMPIPDKVEFVHKESFLNGFLPKKRPLNSTEISQIFTNIQTIAVARALKMGFSQVAQSEDVKKFMLRGVDLSKDHLNTLGPELSRNELPLPMTLETEVYDSTEPPFSDKLMIFHITSLMGYKTVMFGISMASSLRSDIYTTYANLMLEIDMFAKEGLDIMINNEWMEKNPEAVDRRELAKL